MPIDIKPDQLLSRVIRFNAAAGQLGTGILQSPAQGGVLTVAPRLINNLRRIARQQQPNGVIDFLWNAGRALTSFIGGVIRFASFSITGIWGWLVGRIEQLKAFNWNLTDQQLQSILQSGNIMIAQAWGSVAGQGLGWLAGIGVGYGIGLVCPVIGGGMLAKQIAAGVGAEALEELLYALQNALRTTINVLTSRAAVTGYINIRKWIKSAPLPLLTSLFGAQNARFIKDQWGAEGGPDLSFNTRMEEAVESISNPVLQAFVEEMLEESWDSFIEAGFIISQELDDAFQQFKLASTRQIGTERTAYVETVRGGDEVLSITKLPQTVLEAQIKSTITQSRLLHNRDIGALIGQPVEDYLIAKPQSLRLVIKMFTRKEPPFYRVQSDDTTAPTITVPDLKRSSLDWEKIKQAVGGQNGYMYGRFRATANLDNGRQMAIYAATEQEAEERIRALLQLTTAELVTLSITEEKRAGARARNSRLYKQTVRVYPGYFTILNREQVLNPAEGLPSTRGNYRDKKARILLWTQTKPANFEQIVNSLLRRAT